VSTYSVDFDGTYTSDPEAFDAFVALLRSRGHTVIMTTQRCERFRFDIETRVGDLAKFDALVFASGQTKEQAAREAGYAVDVWIDDAPYSVHTALVYRGCA
jgi:hypothetical protein